jgi:hypothetical protein
MPPVVCGSYELSPPAMKKCTGECAKIAKKNAKETNQQNQRVDFCTNSSSRLPSLISRIFLFSRQEYSPRRHGGHGEEMFKTTDERR